MKIGLIDLDRDHKKHGYFPNIAQMKISAYHKQHGDQVEWYTPFEHYDKVYISKVFSTTPDYQLPINADEVVREIANHYEAIDRAKHQTTARTKRGKLYYYINYS